MITGNDDFANWAACVGERSLKILESRFDPRWKLYRGPAVMQDSISGYPFSDDESDQESSFILDHPAAHMIMCLSPNVFYLSAHKIIAVTLPSAEAAPHHRRAVELEEAINDHL